MSLSVNVPGGADSGKKVALKPPHPDWACSKGHENKGRWTRCLVPGCNERRPR